MSNTKTIACESEIKVTGYSTDDPLNYVIAIRLQVRSDEDDEQPHNIVLVINDWDDDVMTSYDPDTHSTEFGITDLPIMFADNAKYKLIGFILDEDTPKDFKVYLESCSIHTCGYYDSDIDVEIDIEHDPQADDIDDDSKHFALISDLPWAPVKKDEDE